MKSSSEEVINKSMRIGISVFFCVYILKVKFNVEPFYAAIAAVSCLQGDLKNSLKVGIQRCIGTILGGGIGLGFIYLFGNEINNGGHSFEIALGVTIIIFSCTYLIKMSGSNTIACIVFLAITTNIMMGKDPYFWAIRRIITTILGVIICLTVNWILNGEIRHEKHTERVKKIVKKIRKFK